MLRRQFSPILRLTRHEQHRIALRHPSNVQRSLDLEVLADMIEHVNAFRVQELAGRLVLHERILGPTVPETLGDCDEFPRPIVTNILRHMFGAAEVQRILRVGRRNDVPARPAFAHMIQRGEAACQGIRLVVGGRGRREQPDRTGVLRYRGQQRQRLEHDGPVRRTVGREQRWLVHLPHSIAIGQEQQVEHSALGDLCQLDRVVEVHDLVRPGVRMAPATKVPA
jgi:hypothetical protein